MAIGEVEVNVFGEWNGARARGFERRRCNIALVRKINCGFSQRRDLDQP